MIIPKFSIELLLKIIKSFEVFGFIFANLIVGLLFYYSFKNFSWGMVCLCLISFFISIIILKNKWLFEFIKKEIVFNETKDNIELHGNENPETSQKNIPIQISLAKCGFIVSRQVFFNVVFELFPVLIIWIGIFGITYLLLNSIAKLFSINQIVVFSPISDFFQIVTVLGIILGVFQYYLQRHEEKSVVKMNFYVGQIRQIIHKETTFDKYYNFISSHGDSKFFNWINETTNPKISYFSLLRALSHDDDAVEGLKKILFPRRRKEGPRQQPLINFQLFHQDSNKKFETIESMSAIDNRKKQLKDSYISFFSNQSRIEEIENKIKNEIDLSEFNILVLSNINIIQEILPDFISHGMKNATYSLLQNNFDEKKVLNDINSSIEFRNLLEFKIMNKFYIDIIN